MSVHLPVLVIAASDSSGGAGLTRDVATLDDFEMLVRCALTAVTAQTDAKVHTVHVVPPEVLRIQLQAAAQDGPIGAIKIGMLATAVTVQIVAEWLPPREQIPIVLDPVLIASSGGVLLDPVGQQALKKLLLPRVTLLTPNLPEAAALLEAPVARTAHEVRAQLKRLQALGPLAVLLKGGHAEDSSSPQSVTDWLCVGDDEPLAIQTARVAARARGTGCSAASAIAAQLAGGVPLVEACKRAQNYVAEMLRRRGTPPTAP